MADKKISDLPDAGALTGSDLLLLSQSGADAKLGLSALASYVPDYIRPADWPAMPATASNKIDILAAVTNNASNYVALSATVTGGYTVNWGDGTSTNHASGAAAEKLYDYSDGDLGAVTSRGYKTAIISITPQVGGNNITAFDLGRKHSRSGLQSYTNPWLDVQVNAPSCTSILFANTLASRIVERIAILAIGAVTSLSSAFSSCTSLQSISFPSGSLASVTSLSSAFSSCTSLQSISFPSGSLASVTSLSSAFSGCTSLQSISFPSGSLASVTSLASAFTSCTSLQSISFPSGSLASVSNLTSAFSGCTSLQSISFPSGSLASVSTTTNAFANCTSLARIENCAIPITFSVASCKLAGAQLDEIYTALPTVSSQTITVTNNHGTVDDTPSIATGKGWTVTGS